MWFPSLIFTFYLWLLTIIDARAQRLPDVLTLSLLWLGLLVNAFHVLVTPTEAIFGAALGYGSLYLVYHLHKALTHKEGLGYGDFKLLGAIGAWLGPLALPRVLLGSALFTLLLYVLLKRHKGWHRQSPIPYGPGLALAGWVVMVGQSGFY